MKISTNREDLLPPLLQVGSVVERRQTLPILANVLISVQKGSITFTATDLEVELKTTIKAVSEDEMEFTLPARKLIDICKALPEGADIELSVEGEKATLRSGRGRYKLGMLPAVDYPGIEPAKASQSFTIIEKDFRQVLGKTQFAMAQQDVRYYLNGMLLEAKQDLLRAVATDGHRLAMCEVAFSDRQDVDVQAILPRKAVLELYRLLADSDKKIRVEVSASHMQIYLENTSFTSKLIDGRFPDYVRVIPSGDTQDMLSDREILRQALARTAILSNEKYRGIHFKLSENLLQLQAHNPEQDEAEEEVEVQYGGEEINIGFNVGYLLDVFGVLQGDEVRLSLIDANSSCLIMSAEEDGSKYVVMPMRI